MYDRGSRLAKASFFVTQQFQSITPNIANFPFCCITLRARSALWRSSSQWSLPLSFPQNIPPTSLALFWRQWMSPFPTPPFAQRALDFHVPLPHRFAVPREERSPVSSTKNKQGEEHRYIQSDVHTAFTLPLPLSTIYVAF